MEGIIYVQSHRLAISMGAARAAALIAAADHGLTVYEYAPRKINRLLLKGFGEQAAGCFHGSGPPGLSETLLMMPPTLSLLPWLTYLPLTLSRRRL